MNLQEIYTAISQLSESDQAQLMLGLLEGEGNFEGEMVDAIWGDDGREETAIVERLLSYKNHIGEPVIDVCGYVTGSKASIIASRAFDMAGGA